MGIEMTAWAGAEDQNKHGTRSHQGALASEHHLGIRMTEHQEELTKTEARAGTTPHVARYVLGVGLVLVIVIFAIILFVAR